MPRVILTVEGDTAQEVLHEIKTLASGLGVGAATEKLGHNDDAARQALQDLRNKERVSLREDSTPAHNFGLSEGPATDAMQPPKNKGGRPRKNPEPVADVFSQAQPSNETADIKGATAPSTDDMFAGGEDEHMDLDTFLNHCKDAVAKTGNQGPKIKAIQDATKRVADTARFKDVPPEKRADVLAAFDQLDL